MQLPAGSVHCALFYLRKVVEYADQKKQYSTRKKIILKALKIFAKFFQKNFRRLFLLSVTITRINTFIRLSS